MDCDSDIDMYDFDIAGERNMHWLLLQQEKTVFRFGTAQFQRIPKIYLNKPIETFGRVMTNGQRCYT